MTHPSHTFSAATGQTRRLLLRGGVSLALAPSLGWSADLALAHCAVMSLVGHQLTLVGFRQGVGSNIDANERRVIEVASPALDNSALLAVDDAVRALRPATKTSLLATRDPRMGSLRERGWTGASGDNGVAVEVLTAQLQQLNATHLILVGPHRAPAKFQLLEEQVGSGNLSGLGFYVDAVRRIKLVESGRSGDGFLGPYAYLAFDLIEARSMKSVRRVTATETNVVATASASDANVPWEALSNDDKTKMLQTLIRRAAQRAVPELLSGV